MDKKYGLEINSSKSCYIIIDYYRDNNPVGKIIRNDDTGHDFFSLSSLLNLMMEIVDPQSAVSDRRFIEDIDAAHLWDENTYPYDFDYKESRGHVATFKISVLFTQRNSWQGIIRWLEAEQELCFRSVLELIKLIDNVANCDKKVKHSV